MALGKEGSSLTAELNRLAGITDVTQYLDEQGAANAYAGTTGLATVGALNVLAGKTTPADYSICNELAGTTGKSAVDALRTIAS